MWSFSILHSGIPAVGILWLVNFDSLCQHLNRSLGFERVEWYKHGERVNPFHTAHFGILTFDIFARETDWWTEVFGKMLTGTHLLSSRRFSLAFSLLARSFRSPELTESQAQISMGTPHDNLTEFYLCHAIGVALADIVVHLRSHVIGLILFSGKFSHHVLMPSYVCCWFYFRNLFLLTTWRFL